MARGRIPSPKKINDLKGDPGKRRRNSVEPEAPEGRPACPEIIAEDSIALEEWNSTCDHLASMGLLSITDKTLLEQYTITYSKWRKAHDNVKKYGDVLMLGKNKDYPTMSPWANWERRYSDDIRKMLVELGLTPAARSRMRQPIEQKKTKSKWEGVIKFAG